MLEPVLTRYDRKAWPREQLKRGHLIWDLHSPMGEGAMRRQYREWSERRESSPTPLCRTSCRLQLGDLVNFTKFVEKVAGRTYPLLFLIPQNEPQCDLL